MSIFELMDLLEDELANSSNIPLSSKKKVDVERVYAILDDMRDELPEEIRKAELLLREKQFILDDAKKQADTIIQEAQQKAEKLVDAHEITKNAEQTAEEILTNAQKNSKEMRASAISYANDVLGDLEAYMEEYLELVQKNRSSLENKSRNSESSEGSRELREEREEATERRGLFRNRRED